MAINNVLFNGGVIIPGKRQGLVLSIIVVFLTLITALVLTNQANVTSLHLLFGGGVILLTFVTGFLILIISYAKNESHFLIIGISILGVTFVEGYHSLALSGIFPLPGYWSLQLIRSFFPLSLGISLLINGLFPGSKGIHVVIPWFVTIALAAVTIIFSSIIPGLEAKPFQIFFMNITDWILVALNLVLFVQFIRGYQRADQIDLGVMFIFLMGILSVGFTSFGSQNFDYSLLFQTGAFLCVMGSIALYILEGLVEEGLLRVMVDFMPDLMYLKNRQSQYMVNNHAHLLQLGVSSQSDVRGKSDKDFFPLNLAEGYFRDEQQFLENGKPLRDHEEMYEDQTTGEKNCWTVSTKIPIYNNNGDVIGLVGSGRDNTRLKRAEANLHSLINHLKDNSNNYANEATHLAATAKDATNVTEGISKTIQQVAEGANQQASAINQITVSIEQIAKMINNLAHGGEEQAMSVSTAVTAATDIMDAIQKVSSSAEYGADSSRKASTAALTGAETISNTIQAMNQIKIKVEFSEKKVEEMGNRSNQIGVILETINDIASQTNMLALNAAIEAARAGEHGKGFSIVADEVRKLAERSKAATKEIDNLIQTIRQTVDESIIAMQSSGKEVTSGAVMAQDAEKALVEIISSVKTVSQQMNEIAESSKKMEHGSISLKNAMDTVSMVVERNTAAVFTINKNSQSVEEAIGNIASVSEENSASVQEISAASGEMFTQVEQVRISAKTVSEMAENMRELVSQFDPTVLAAKSKRFGESN